MSDDDEIQQVRAAQQGNPDALAALVTRHQQAVRACLAARLDDPHEAEDLTQEVFVTAWRKLGEFDPERPLAPWLRSIAMNLLRNHWRKFRAHPIGGNAELASLLDQRIALDCTPDREPALLHALHECVEQLDGPARELLRRRYGEEQSVHEIAALLQRGYSAVTMQLHRLRELLAECIENKVHATPPP
jgi:RNA polymerase sigma-70 factor (ECF subfamily)